MSRKPILGSLKSSNKMATESESLKKPAAGNELPLPHFWQCIASVRLHSTRCLTDALRSARCAAQRSGQRSVLWNLKSTILLGIPWCRVRSSSCNRSAPPVVFRSWCAQLKNWWNTKSCTERNVARHTPLHNLPSARGTVLNCRIVKILTLLMVIIPTPGRSHANFVHVPSLADARIRDVVDEPDPENIGDCLL